LILWSWLAALDSNYTEFLSVSMFGNQLVNGFQLPPVRSTKYSIHRKWLKVRGLGGSIARNVGFDNVLIQTTSYWKPD
jgi:hypothetical protein